MTNSWPETGDSAGKWIKAKVTSSTMTDLINRHLMISIRDLSLQNKVQVIKIYVEPVWKNEYMIRCENRSRKKCISSMKRDIAVQTIIYLCTMQQIYDYTNTNIRFDNDALTR